MRACLRRLGVSAWERGNPLVPGGARHWASAAGGGWSWALGNSTSRGSSGILDGNEGAGSSDGTGLDGASTSGGAILVRTGDGDHERAVPGDDEGGTESMLVEFRLGSIGVEGGEPAAAFAV